MTWFSNWWYKKEKPLQGLPGLGGGVGGNLVGAAGPDGPFEATGGNQTWTYNGKKIHVWTSSGTLTTPGNCDPQTDVEYFVVAGGGAAGGGLGGGGGAGGIRLSGPHPINPKPDNPNITIPGNEAASYTVTVGAGGAGPTSPAGTNTGSLPGPVSNGGYSSFGQGATFEISVGGGGAGAGYPGTGNNGATQNPALTPPNAGGSGGGGSGSTDLQGGYGGSGQPWDPDGDVLSTTGGNGQPTGDRRGGGGGGSQSGGKHGTQNACGGIGTQLPTTFKDPQNPYGFRGYIPPNNFEPSFFAGGGGGGGDANGGIGGAGNNPSGPWGGGPTIPWSGSGNGGSGSGSAGGSAQANSGSGAGGGSASAQGGSGGSGIVFIAYPT